MLLESKRNNILGQRGDRRRTGKKKKLWNFVFKKAGGECTHANFPNTEIQI